MLFLVLVIFQVVVTVDIGFKNYDSWGLPAGSLIPLGSFICYSQDFELVKNAYANDKHFNCRDTGAALSASVTWIIFKKTEGNKWTKVLDSSYGFGTQNMYCTSGGDSEAISTGGSTADTKCLAPGTYRFCVGEGTARTNDNILMAYDSTRTIETYDFPAENSTVNFDLLTPVNRHTPYQWIDVPYHFDNYECGDHGTFYCDARMALGSGSKCLCDEAWKGDLCDESRCNFGVDCNTGEECKLIGQEYLCVAEDDTQFNEDDTLGDYPNGIIGFDTYDSFGASPQTYGYYRCWEKEFVLQKVAYVSSRRFHCNNTGVPLTGFASFVLYKKNNAGTWDRVYSTGCGFGAMNMYCTTPLVEAVSSVSSATYYCLEPGTYRFCNGPAADTTHVNMLLAYNSTNFMNAFDFPDENVTGVDMDSMTPVYTETPYQYLTTIFYDENSFCGHGNVWCERSADTSDWSPDTRCVCDGMNGWFNPRSSRICTDNYCNDGDGCPAQEEECRLVNHNYKCAIPGKDDTLAPPSDTVAQGDTEATTPTDDTQDTPIPADTILEGGASILSIMGLSFVLIFVIFC